MASEKTARENRPKTAGHISRLSRSGRIYRGWRRDDDDRHRRPRRHWQCHDAESRD